MRNFIARNAGTRASFRLGALSILTLAAAALGGQSCLTVDDSLGDDAGLTTPTEPGEICFPAAPEQTRIRVEPASIVLPRCDGPLTSCPARYVNVIVEPDVCGPTAVYVASDDPEIAPATGVTYVDLHQPVVTLAIPGGAKIGSTTINVGVPDSEGALVATTIAVEVVEPTPLDCSKAIAASGALSGGGSVKGKDGLTGATISLPKGADAPNAGSFLWSVKPFQASVACGKDSAPDGYIALGPAVTFGPEDATFKREVPLSLPINPALMPEKARFRHLRLMYSGPAFKEPRFVPVADPRVEKVDGQWAVTFKAPRLGTYQAVVAEDAGTKSRRRRLTHRAVIGVSMGGAGTAMFGLRHHNLFDVIAPLGGPVDWTYMLHYIENNHLAGFRPIAKGTTLADIKLTSASCASAADCQADETCLGPGGLPPGKCVLMPSSSEPYEHGQTFNTWWYESVGSGNGGSFDRKEYAQIFRDLALMFGNPNGENLSPGGENLPAGVPPDDPSQVGDHLNGECKVWVDPLDGPDHAAQQAILNSCPQERCSHPLTLQGYYDDEYNPDGSFPVISVCDGADQDSAMTPYANTWTPTGNEYPLEVGLAVDYNGNGVRDELEPVIRAGHEPWADVGVDGLPSAQEPGYAKGVNDDPAGDDYDAQYNPAGAEGDMRFEPGEPFEDVGLDGVPGTKQQPPFGYQKPGDGYDVGEGDGEFTIASGLRRFWDSDPHSVVRRMTPSVPGGELTDDALARIDLWTDGGTRDLFNFAAASRHLVGAFAARGRVGSYFTGFTEVPGLDPKTPGAFEPPKIIYEDLPGIVMQRYGKVDPTAEDLKKGSGQHVGTAPEIAFRLQTALYYIGSRWNEPELRTLVEESADDPDPSVDECQISGTCELEFTSTFGRKGPVAISLPPGYANLKQKNKRYPVVYMLHGYGQTPDDLVAAILFLRNWMNSPTESNVSRLPKAIVVYVDGRCRVGASGKAECIRGTFFADSAREDGAQNERWWLELMDYIDQNYRTMGESEIDWIE